MNEIKIKQIAGYHLEAINEEGNTASIDAAPTIGGTGKGMRPMQMLLASLGGCSTIDILSILKKQKQVVKDINLTLQGERAPKGGANPYKSINIHFQLKGDLSKVKVAKAIDLSVTKYCSVIKTLDASVAVSYTFEII